MKKFMLKKASQATLLLLALSLGLCLIQDPKPAMATYDGYDQGTYVGSSCIHFSVAITSMTTDPIFEVADYSSSFDTLDRMEFEVISSTAIYLSATSAPTTGTSTNPNAAVRLMTDAQVYNIGGRNKASIYAVTENGITGSALITGTIWGH